MSHKGQGIFMSSDNSDPYVAGQGIVKIIVIALLLLLVGDRFGIPISWLSFACAMISAIALYWIFGLIRRFAVRARE